MTRRCRRWTAAEDQLLRDLYPHEKARAIQHRMPHRARKSIQERARLLGVTKTRAFIDSQLAEARANGITAMPTELMRANQALSVLKRHINNRRQA